MKNTQAGILNEIAQDISCGNICYYNPKTNELITMPDFSKAIDDVEPYFEEEIKKIKKQKSDLIKFEPLKSAESFRIMKEFVAQLEPGFFQSKLENVLSAHKPFKQFKIEIDRSDHRDDWFAFKQKAIEKMIEEELNSADNS